MKRMLLVFITTFLSTSAYATVDQLYVNDISKEYQYSDNGCLGFIGWHNIIADPSMYYNLEDKLLRDGYNEMNIPFKIELIVIVIVVFLTIITFIIRKNLKQRMKNDSI